MDDSIRHTLFEIAGLLESGSDFSASAMVRDALASEPDVLDFFLVSNELWGGAGSIADQSLMGDDGRRVLLLRLLIRLGELQIRSGTVNQRTRLWVSAFEKSVRPDTSFVL